MVVICAALLPSLADAQTQTHVDDIDLPSPLQQVFAGMYHFRDAATGDTLAMIVFNPITVFPPERFRNKAEEQFYWRTVRDVKKTLPYAKMISRDMEFADEELAKIQDPKARRRWWKKYEKYLFQKYEQDFRGMYASQGQMLMKLMDRESDRTSYELIKQYRGKASANWWQFVAKLFKNDLKEEYDAQDKDKIVERVINLVEAGQL